MNEYEEAMLDLQLCQIVLLKDILGVLLRKNGPEDELWAGHIDFTMPAIHRARAVLNKKHQ